MGGQARGCLQGRAGWPQVVGNSKGRGCPGTLRPQSPGSRPLPPAGLCAPPPPPLCLCVPSWLPVPSGFLPPPGLLSQQSQSAGPRSHSHALEHTAHSWLFGGAQGTALPAPPPPRLLGWQPQHRGPAHPAHRSTGVTAHRSPLTPTRAPLTPQTRLPFLHSICLFGLFTERCLHPQNVKGGRGQGAGLPGPSQQPWPDKRCTARESPVPELPSPTAEGGPGGAEGWEGRDPRGHGGAPAAGGPCGGSGPGVGRRPRPPVLSLRPSIWLLQTGDPHP